MSKEQFEIGYWLLIGLLVVFVIVGLVVHWVKGVMDKKIKNLLFHNPTFPRADRISSNLTLHECLEAITRATTRHEEDLREMRSAEVKKSITEEISQLKEALKAKSKFIRLPGCEESNFRTYKDMRLRLAELQYHLKHDVEIRG